MNYLLSSFIENSQNSLVSLLIIEQHPHPVSQLKIITCNDIIYSVHLDSDMEVVSNRLL